VDRAVTSPELLARAFNAAPNGVVLIDGSGTIVAANEELEKMFGHAHDALVGLPIETLLPTTLHESHVGLRSAFFSKPERRSMGADSYCEICVVDDGPGVPEAAKERIFKLFQTLTATERGSSGISLALTKRVIEVHGGRIEVVSPVRDGRGACFRFWWPRFPQRTSDE